ncbi:DUF3572 domain-containing protein [Frigidibacter sp. ROC022]|uniref:DUF3572 domain-containing protein n=1 Tax=Frigidibacter sp. ROC022 TaxID=2971796 RepID=UPI00215AFEE4|nr:DUF3572 domain-containing protein [Frigidibacter sp. ROC022]MCR8725452.1 DUF3572 domain-containing protein [Frigidibacter sp. ROC022]
MRREDAEVVALQVLAWLAGNDELWPVFLGSTGATGDLRTAAQDPTFLAALLDFLTQDDAWVMAFCDAEGLSYETPMAARQALPGGGMVHWT